MSKYSAIILAGGKGIRYQSKKQELLFHGKPLWMYPYDTALKLIPKDRIIVVGVDIPGGSTRTESVQKGLLAIPSDTDRVIILEAARPLVTIEQIIQILSDDHPSSTFVRPLVNSVIYRNGTYVDRDNLFVMNSPQAFDYAMLLEAYRSGRFCNLTDDTRVMYEYHGIKPNFIETGSNLYKLTYPEDIHIIEAIYQMQKKTEKDICNA